MENISFRPGMMQGAEHEQGADQEQNQKLNSINCPVDHKETAFGTGLLSDIGNFIYNSAPIGEINVALAGAVAFMAGLTGGAYNVSGTGLNQYVLIIGQTGIGKEGAPGGITKLVQAVSASVPAVYDFLGGNPVSIEALLKRLAGNPCGLLFFGEAGYKIKAMTARNANPAKVAMMAGLLDIYGKSGAGSILQGQEHSDRDKNTIAAKSPALSILGDTTPETLFENLGESDIANGFLPRWLMFHAGSKRGELNENALKEPWPKLQQAVADLATQCLQSAHIGRVTDVKLDGPAQELSRGMSSFATRNINDATAEVNRHLWNRAHLKTLKLAALRAVGNNYLNPIINEADFVWAMNMVMAQTEGVLAKFERGEVGELGGNQNKQQAEVVRVIRDYMSRSWLDCSKYHGDEIMHRGGVISFAHIQQRLSPTAAFKNDRIGPRDAVIRTIKSLLESDIIREVSQKQMVEMFGKHPRAFVVSDPKAILAGP